jgi:hypothetical protein
MDSNQDKITTMHSAYHAVCKLPGRVATPLVAKFYYAHGTHLAQQTLVNTFEQVHHAWLYLISAVLNRLNTCLRAKNAPGSVAQYLAALRHKNTHLTPSIPVTAVQTARLLTDRGRKQTHVPNLTWLVDSLPASNDPGHLKLQRITDGYTATMIRRRFLVYGLRVLLPPLNKSAALAGYLPSHWSVKNIESTNLKGGEY